MTFFFHILVSIAIIIFKTAIFPFLPVFNVLFDFFIPVVIYMGLFRSIRESIPSLLIQGIVMDSLSGAPFGIYLSCYLWLFAAVYWFKGFLHIHNYILLALIVFLGVLIQNGILILMDDLPLAQWSYFSGTINIVVFQLLSSILLGPFMIVWMRSVFIKWRQLIYRFSEDKI